ncbi:hypothetical protein [Erwinia tasmaniensis]|uniref:Uncharacterized protein n=1 Tax=Erwinia tasmaniensis (strain DSM 17950 / CFBP 7177 / CIP 109463 / NCPPB 4357 / Et1/99) TaxID=465817 RepID=B2VCT7_ERWT9|nr:hypothetical protein [Erwinia tasmaniensis]CAO98038.1 Hypothetical protein ETA_29920 [Erwinia tasmaniensis Et1/99]
MPYCNASKQKETYLKEIERDDTDPVFQQVSQGSPGVSPHDKGGGLSTRSDNGRLFTFITEVRWQEAQEFRCKGYNSQVPEVDARLLTQLLDDLAAAKSRLCLQANVMVPLSSRWLLDQIVKIERLTGHLSDNLIQGWVEQVLPRKSIGGSEEAAFGSRHTAQSMVRRLESTLQTLIRVVHTLRAIDDYSTPEKWNDMLVAELTNSFASGDGNTVIRALERITAEASGHAAWASLMQIRAAAYEADKPTIFGEMIATTQREAEKANKKARELRGASQAFFSDIAAYLQSLSHDWEKALIKANQSASSPIIAYANNDGPTVPLSRSNTFPQRIKANLTKKKEQGQVVLAVAKGIAYRGARIAQHGHLTKTPLKEPEHIIADSIIRSIFWQQQQPAVKIQHASAKLLSKVGELKKIEGILASYAAADGWGSEQESRNTTVNHPGEDDLDAQVRKWVSDSIEQEKPESQLAAKVATLERLLRCDIATARNLVKRLGITEESAKNMLRRQRFAVLKMRVERSPVVTSSLRAVGKLLPDIARDLTKSITALDKALLLAESPTRDFAEVKKQAGYAQLLATKVKESLSAESARLTGRSLDEHSRGSRLAKHWANLAKEQNMGNYPPPDAEQVLFSLQEQGLLAGTLSTGDPAGYLFATRLAGELENANDDELIIPMSPEQYTALEKGLIEYIVKWGQKRTSHEVARIVIELSFEQALNTVSFNASSLFRLPYKVLKTSIKLPYNVNKVNNYTMPGHDKPYKAIYGLLGKKLKQLGFNLLTAPVPGVIKLVAGAAVTAGATLHNLRAGKGEKTFSAVYQHVAEGKQSEKIKMDSVGGMIFDSVLDTATMTTFKGARRAWQSGRSVNSAISDNAFASEHDVEKNEERHPQAQRSEMITEKDNPTWGHAAANEREAVPVSHSSPLQQQKNIKPFSDDREPGSDQPRIRHKRAVTHRAPPPILSILSMA